MSDYPVACLKCRKPNSWNVRKHYDHLVSIGYTETDALDYLNIKSDCCRTMNIQYAPALDRLIRPQEEDEFNRTVENDVRIVSTRFEVLKTNPTDIGKTVTSNRGVI